MRSSRDCPALFFSRKKCEIFLTHTILFCFFAVRGETMDYVEFAIYPSILRPDQLDQLRSDCLAIVSQFSVDYLWHRDPFNIAPVNRYHEAQKFLTLPAKF